MEIESPAYIASPAELGREQYIPHNPLTERISNPRPNQLAQVTMSDAYVRTAEDIP